MPEADAQDCLTESSTLLKAVSSASMFSFLRCSSVKDRWVAPPLVALAVVGPEGTVGAWRLFIFLLFLLSAVGPEPRERVLCRKWHYLNSEATRR